MPSEQLAHLLNDNDRDQLRRLVADRGLNATAKLLDLSRGVISSVVAGISVRKGSIALVRQALLAHKQRKNEAAK